jgi:hypothetical protein
MGFDLLNIDLEKERRTQVTSNSKLTNVTSPCIKSSRLVIVTPILPQPT